MDAAKETIRWSGRAALPVLRLCALLGVSGAVSASLLTRALGHELGAAALRGGRAVWGIASPHRSNAPQRLVLNGAELFVQTSTVQAPWDQVLDEVRRSCAARGVAGSVGSAPLARLLAKDGVFEWRTQRDGTVACLEWPRPIGGVAELSRRLLGDQGLMDDTETDIGALGSFRYTYARRESADRTAVLGIWSSGPLHVGALFPSSGDAPGEEDPELPRPQGSARTLSVRHEALARPLVVYRAPGAAEAVAASYGEELRRAGLVVDDAAPSDTSPPGSEISWFVRSAAHTRFIALVEEGGWTWVVSAPLP